ncbi:hypothetical protein D3C77_651060 [compost metagenome]
MKGTWKILRKCDKNTRLVLGRITSVQLDRLLPDENKPCKIVIMVSYFIGKNVQAMRLGSQSCSNSSPTLSRTLLNEFYCFRCTCNMLKLSLWHMSFQKLCTLRHSYRMR